MVVPGLLKLGSDLRAKFPDGHIVISQRQATISHLSSFLPHPQTQATHD